jgi:preprotein translocase subunit SecE
MSKMPETPATIALPKSKRGTKGFFAEVKREIKKVNWPTKEETTRLTGVVLTVCGLVILILMGLNYFFDFFVSLLENTEFKGF